MRRDWQVPLTAVTIMLVLLIGAMAGGSMWVILRMHGRIAHVAAAQSVAEQGDLIAKYLAGQASGGDAAPGELDWRQFSRLTRGLHVMEQGLEYVSVIMDGVIVYHEQMPGLEGAGTQAEPRSEGEVRLGRKLLSVGNAAVPVVTFSTDFTRPDGKSGVVEIALRRETVAREEYGVSSAVARMFRVALATVVVSFGACLALILWVMRREKQREDHRRREEHLAFSGVFANGIAHDFRNPMSSVRLDAQMLHKEAAKGGECRLDRVAELSDRMRSTIDRMDKSFQEFLYLSKPSADTKETVDLPACVRECVEILKPRLERAEVTVQLNVKDPRIQVLAHPVSLQRALINVMTNAEQFSRKGQAVTIDVFQSARLAVVDVADRGPGIPKQERKRIFDMFVSSRPGGTGLGLFLARAAIERCGGTIRVVDREEGGACFRISLPLAGGDSTGGPAEHE